MILNIKLCLLELWKEACTVVHSVLAQTYLMHYRKKKIVKLLTVYWE